MYFCLFCLSPKEMNERSLYFSNRERSSSRDAWEEMSEEEWPTWLMHGGGVAVKLANLARLFAWMRANSSPRNSTSLVKTFAAFLFKLRASSKHTLLHGVQYCVERRDVSIQRGSSPDQDVMTRVLQSQDHH
jgi:hypothetical protein